MTPHPAGNYTSPCPYLPLGDFVWAGEALLIPPKSCPPLSWNPTVYTLIAALHGASYGIGIELALEVIITFQKRNTLYFWSMLSTILGTATLTAGYELKLFSRAPHALQSVVLGIGGFMTTGCFMLILYSRLNLLTQNKNLLRSVLGTIIATVLLGKTPLVVGTSLNGKVMIQAIAISGYLESMYMLLSLFISGLYIYYFRKFIKETGRQDGHGQSLFLLLISAQAVIFAIDLTANMLEWINYVVPLLMMVPLRYSLKTKIEFLILQRLVRFSQEGNGQLDFNGLPADQPIRFV